MCPRPVANLIQVPEGIRGRNRAVGQHADFGEAGAEFIMQILGDAPRSCSIKRCCSMLLAFLDMFLGP